MRHWSHLPSGPGLRTEVLAGAKGLVSTFHSVPMRFAHGMSLGVRGFAAARNFLGVVPFRFGELRHALVTADGGIFGHLVAELMAELPASLV